MFLYEDLLPDWIRGLEHSRDFVAYYRGVWEMTVLNSSSVQEWMVKAHQRGGRVGIDFMITVMFVLSSPLSGYLESKTSMNHMLANRLFHGR